MQSTDSNTIIHDLPGSTDRVRMLTMLCELNREGCEELSDANAGLIAAAPELYDACKYLLADDTITIQRLEHALLLMRVAVAKTEGK